MLARRSILSASAAGLLLSLMLVSSAAGTAQTAIVRTSRAANLRTGHSGAFVLFASRLQARLAPAGTHSAPSDAQCRKDGGEPCYSPQEIRHSYGVDQLFAKGYDGAGETIVIVDSYGSPTLRSDLATFDAGYGLPSPPSLKILAPLGAVPFDPDNSDMVGWALETTLDVEWSHAMAPGAGIVVLTSPVDETEGVQGLPNSMTSRISPSTITSAKSSPRAGPPRRTRFSTGPARRSSAHSSALMPGRPPWASRCWPLQETPAARTSS